VLVVGEQIYRCWVLEGRQVGGGSHMCWRKCIGVQVKGGGKALVFKDKYKNWRRNIRFEGQE
jgi:hypothetical protein